MCLIVYMYPISMKCPERPEEGSRSPKAGVNGCKLLGMGSRNQT